MAGRDIRNPLTYVASNFRGIDASTIITSLSVGRAELANPLPYWPTYSEADPDQRAMYLDWMASDRSDGSVPLGYPFIFFYGLERRVFVDGQDIAICQSEVSRLLSIFGETSASFRGYASQFLTFSTISRFSELTERHIEAQLLPLARRDEAALSASLAWYFTRSVLLPAKLAVLVAETMEDAKRGVVVQRSWNELNELFCIRYGEKHGSGLQLVAGKRSRTIAYHPASATLLRTQAKPSIEVPDVLARRAQFKSLVEIWNGCITDLRKMTTRKASGPEHVTREVWEAMPQDLRAQIDHPDLDRWLELLSKSPRIGSAHLVTAGQLGELMSLEYRDRISAPQSRKLAEVAATMAIAIEPELRVAPRQLAWDAPLAAWRADDVEVPNPAVYAPASALLSLLLSIALSDGSADEREITLITTIIEDTFVLDESMRQRVEALKEILLRAPPNGAVVRRLRETKTPEQLRTIGRMLVAVAAADGVLADGEHKALRSLFKGMGLSQSELDAELVSVGLRSESDALVTVRAAGTAPKGEPIPEPSRDPHAVQLDQSAIARILSETHEVATILAGVLDTTDDENDPIESADAKGQTVAVNCPAADGESLDPRYQAVLAELLARVQWSDGEIRKLVRSHQLFPGAVMEAINSWSEDKFGDALIVEDDGWSLNSNLVQRLEHDRTASSN